MKLTGQIFTFFGAIIMVGTIVIGTILSVNGFRTFLAASNDILELSGPGNSVTHNFDAGREMQLYTYKVKGASTNPKPKCSATGPAPVQQSRSTGSSVTVGSESRVSFASLIFTKSGTYTITCDQPGVTIGPPVSVGSILNASMGLILAISGGFGGLVTLIIGIILWVMGSRQQTEPQAPAGPPTY